MRKNRDIPHLLRNKAHNKNHGRGEQVARVSHNAELLHELQVHQIELEMQNETLRQAQIELEKSCDRYLNLYDFAPIGYLTLTSDMIIAEINLTGAALLGIERNKLLNSRFLRFVAPEYRDQWHVSFLGMLKDTDSRSCELALQRGDGSLFYAGMSCQYIESAGKTLRVALTDITERRRIEIMLRESEEKLAAIFAGALDGILLASANTGQFNTCNPAFCRMLGYSTEEIGRLCVRDIHPQQDLPYVLDQFAMHMRGELTFSSGVPVLRKDGSVFYADIQSAPVSIGGIAYLVGIFRDVTERKEAGERLLSSTQRQELLFQSSRDALMTLAPPLWKFTGANRATLELFGVSGVNEFVELTPWGISPEFQMDGSFSDERAREMIAIAMRDGSHCFEWEHRRLDGRTFTADVLLTRMQVGKEVFVQATVRDISERKRIELELREQRQLLRELSAQNVASREAEAKHIACEVHDELGQILTALRMDISLLRIRLSERDAGLGKKTDDMLAMVDKAIKGARNVALNLHPAVLELGIVPAIGWLCDNFPGNRDTACTLLVNEVPAGLNDTQTLAIFRIVQESLTNVARYAEADGVKVVIGQCGDEVLVEVCDDGKGFDIVGITARKSFGLLGMQERALAAGGKVEIISAPLQGTTVSIRIPTICRND